MDNLLSKLIEILDKEYEEGKKLIEILDEKKKIMKSANFNEINKNVEKEQTVVYKILNLEDDRAKIIIEIANKLNIQPEDLTISKLKDFAPMYKEKFSELKEKISNVFNKIIQLSQIDKYLIERSLLFIEDRIKVIKHAMSLNQVNILDKKI